MKLTEFNILFTILSILIAFFVDNITQNFMAYSLIVSIGILHGANDISLIHYIKKNTKSEFKYILIYIAVVAFMSILFIKAETLALLLFVVVSCYHFGEQHFYHKFSSSRFLIKMLYISYGVLVFGLIFYFNATETIKIIYELTEVKLTKNLFLYLVICGSFTTTLFTFLNLKFLNHSFNWFEEVFLIILFLVAFKAASLIWAFTIYFVFWHSIPSLKDQIKKLYGKISKKNILIYIKGSFVNWLVSCLGLIFLYYVTDYLKFSFITLFFAFLAAITIPHVIVMFFLNKKTE